MKKSTRFAIRIADYSDVIVVPKNSVDPCDLDSDCVSDDDDDD